MASLTACSTTRPQHGWRDATPTPVTGKTVQVLENWGEKPDAWDAADPEIAPGFLLTLFCLADSKINGDYRVSFSGDLPLPYDIRFNTTGMTLSQVKKKLSEVYKPYFKTPSEIEVRLKERRFWVDVRGLVDKPGQYLVEPESSLDFVIGLAGGTNKIDPPLYVRIQKGQKAFVFDLNQYYNHGEDQPQIQGWLGGEVLFFQKEIAGSLGYRTISSTYRLPVYLFGEVRKPGSYTLSMNSDFLDTLVQAGGFTERADLDNIELIRSTTKTKRVYGFSWRDLQKAPIPVPGDVFFIHADTQTKGERRTYFVFSIISALATIVSSVVLVLAYNRGRI